MSWALCAKRLNLSHPNIPILALDLKGHGSSTNEVLSTDLLFSTVITDISSVLRKFFKDVALPSFVLCGHSVGASLAIRLASSKTLPFVGVVCVDLVEDTAVQSISHIRATIEARPTSFESLEKAIAWSMQSLMIRSLESARVSMPAQLAFDRHDQCYRWRTELRVPVQVWLDLYSGLSDLFLELRVPKLLLIACVDRMGLAMSVAHMQGRLQVSVLPNSGHQIQEDQSEETAEKLATFWKRYDFGGEKNRS